MPRPIRFVLLAAAMALLSGLLWSCAPQPSYAQAAVQPAASPELPFTVQVAINALGQQLQQNRQEHDALVEALHKIEAEYAHDHPGYHYDEETGKPVANVVPKPGAPAEKK
jgi:hypothetical protein